MFVEHPSQKFASSVGVAYSDDVAPAELCLFLNRQATKMSALTGFSRKREPFAVPLKIRAPGFFGVRGHVRAFNAAGGNGC
jgi:hypothetical protein